VLCFLFATFCEQSKRSELWVSKKKQLSVVFSPRSQHRESQKQTQSSFEDLRGKQGAVG
jgi:hypothetical protein